jgi:hypothetical protein
MTFSTDIDIDFRDRADACQVIKHIPASMRQKGELLRHPSGVYLQNVPIHPLLDIASIPHVEAENYGYFKIDLLSNSVYEGVKDKAHLMELMAREVPWEFFQDRSFVSRLAHIHSHYGVVMSIKPKSIEDLAIVLALIRPSKKHLIQRSRAEIEKDIWINDGSSYAFKRSHAIAYAMSITVQLQLLIEKISEEIDAGGEFVFPV